ncbi:ParB/RepB/Spo0J family partition protein [Vibrio tritonius]|uniref:ParB/RepB/Spo0J family partition protein n=1 Tax=Vibrio tritonius TaxID=1435069 RepID=A0ABS7YGQ3_9VIBR|nr:ParB/RepB/Spo0J family partition protein [Vibrio tritonius]MCA2014533.1 ParB/RepB/Spo0J family partition protein [Vibrio tritonius]
MTTREVERTTNAATVIQSEQSNLEYLPPKTLLDPPWGNHRTSRNEKAWAEFVESVRAWGGVYQPVLARKVDGHLELIAGFGRRDAAVLLNLAVIPVIIKNLGDSEAYRLSVSENCDREAIMFIDEVRAFRKIVADCNGDLNAAASSMGWDVKKLKLALQVLKATEKVQKSVGVTQENGFILTVSHAAELSRLDDQLQDSSLDAIIEKKLSVKDLRSLIANVIRRRFSNAIFDYKNVCKDCRHNGCEQFSMFEEDNLKAECFNPSCFETKNADALSLRVSQLEAEHGKIIMLSTISNDYMTVSEENVGRMQFVDGCLACEKLNVIVCDTKSAVYDYGSVLEHQCLDHNCFQNKLDAIHQMNVQSDTSGKSLVALDASVQDNLNCTLEDDSDNSEFVNTKSRGATSNIEAMNKRLVVDSQIEIRGLAAERLFNELPKFSFAVLAAAVGLVAGTNEQPLLSKNISSNMGLEIEKLQNMLNESLKKIIFDNGGRKENLEPVVIDSAIEYIDNFRQDAIEAWLPNKENLSSMTKTVRQQCVVQSGWAELYKLKKGDAALVLFEKMNTSDQVDEILNFDFDWGGFAPSHFIAGFSHYYPHC